MPHAATVDDDLNAAARAARDEMRSRHLQAEDLAAYAVAGERGFALLLMSTTNKNCRTQLYMLFLLLSVCSSVVHAPKAVLFCALLTLPIGADDDLAAAVGNQAPVAGGLVSVRSAGGGAKSGKGPEGAGKKEKKGMLYAKQQDSRKRGLGGGGGGGKGKKQKK